LASEPYFEYIISEMQQPWKYPVLISFKRTCTKLYKLIAQLPASGRIHAHTKAMLPQAALAKSSTVGLPVPGHPVGHGTQLMDNFASKAPLYLTEAF
jgi:hypothetical protein